MESLTPHVVLRLGPLGLTDTAVTATAISLVLLVVGVVLARWGPVRTIGEVLYEVVEHALQDMVTVDARPLVPLVLTLWLFIGAANLVGLVPGLHSPTRDLSVTAALATLSLGAGHVYGFRSQGLAYLKVYAEPSWVLLPFNLLAEVGRTLALALRLFGNVMSEELILAILLGLAGVLVPVPLMLLTVLTGVVQAYIFGVLTLVFTASAMEAAPRPHPDTRGGSA